MADWNKKSISKQTVQNLESKYSLDTITASILARRNITDGKDILYYAEDDLRFQHNPFLFANMEDAVDRILDAREENEKVLIFGDRDVDGITSTTVLFECLSSMGMDVSYRLPQGDDPYGLTIEAVDTFANEMGTLIICVDNGISCANEIRHAQELGIDVIVADHHNPPETVPECIILDAKCEDSGYPFKEISGCAVAYKIVSALRFARTQWYKTEIALLNARNQGQQIVIECLKLRNLVPVNKMEFTVDPLSISLMDTKLAVFLKNQIIFVWDESNVGALLKKAFGNSAGDINRIDIRNECAKLFPKTANLPLSTIKNMSKLAKYGNHEPTELGGFYNIFVTYTQMLRNREFPNFSAQEEKDLQLVTLAALADIMPMQNENRIFAKQGLASINAGRVRSGLAELMSQLNMLGKRVTSTDLSWIIVSNLNAAGRLGQAELAAELFLSQDAIQRDNVAKKIIELNNERKRLTQEAADFSAIQAEASIGNYSNKLCVVMDERINRGVSGILAGRLMANYNIPAIALTCVGDSAIGSMRSCRGFSATEFLGNFKDLFDNYGGHDYAAGFSLAKNKLDQFKEMLKEKSKDIVLGSSDEDSSKVDAEIPEQFLTPKLLDINDSFEPFGEANPILTFMSKNIKVLDAITMGKGQKLHLKITVGNNKIKWPCIFWNQGERLNRDFKIGDNVDMLYHVERNLFNGVEIPQINLIDLKKSE